MPTDRVPRTEDDVDPVKQRLIPVHLRHVDAVQDVRVVPMVNGMGVSVEIHFSLLDIHLSIGTFVIVLTVIVVQVGVDNHVHVLADPTLQVTMGDQVRLDLDTSKAQFFDPETEESLLWV